MKNVTRRGTMTPRSAGSPFQTIVTGAGISRDAPASLPSAADLVDTVWFAVRESLGGLNELRPGVEKQLPRMRMEQFLELLSGPGAIPPRLLVTFYNMVGGAAFNENHMRLAALDAVHFTLNMDTLIEDAGPGANVVHLHGVWHRPRTIRTTVSHYSKGLSPRLRRRFGRALRSQDVLVIGYSGRDTDVIPLFDDYPPATITWVGPNPAGWKREVKTLQRRYYTASSPSKFTPVDATAGDFLPTHVPTVPAATGAKQPHPPTHLDRNLTAHTTRPQRVIAVGRLLFDMGLYGELHQFLEPEHKFTGRDEINRRKLIARSLRRQDKPALALEWLTRPPRRVSEVVPWLRNINEIAAVAARAARPQLRRHLQPVILLLGLLPFRRLRVQRLLPHVRIAKDLAVRGRVRDAIELIDRVTESKNVRYTLDESGLVDALTWSADAHKDIGDLVTARERAERAIRSVSYADHSQAAFALWKYAEVRVVAGPDPTETPATFDADVSDHFVKARTQARLDKAAGTQAWIHGTWAEYLIPRDLLAARKHLAAAARLGAARPTHEPLGRTYHLLQRAALEMTEGSFPEAEASAEAGRHCAEQHDYPAAEIQARELLAHIRWRRDPSRDLASELDQLADEYQHRDLPLNEARARARARITVAALRGVPTSGSVVRQATDRGWQDILRRINGDDGPYPWPWAALL